MLFYFDEYDGEKGFLYDDLKGENKILCVGKITSGYFHRNSSVSSAITPVEDDALEKWNRGAKVIVYNKMVVHNDGAAAGKPVSRKSPRKTQSLKGNANLRRMLEEKEKEEKEKGKQGESELEKLDKLFGTDDGSSISSGGLTTTESEGFVGGTRQPDFITTQWDFREDWEAARVEDFVDGFLSGKVKDEKVLARLEIYNKGSHSRQALKSQQDSGYFSVKELEQLNRIVNDKYVEQLTTTLIPVLKNKKKKLSTDEAVNFVADVLEPEIKIRLMMWRSQQGRDVAIYFLQNPVIERKEGKAFYDDLIRRKITEGAVSKQEKRKNRGTNSNFSTLAKKKAPKKRRKERRKANEGQKQDGKTSDQSDQNKATAKEKQD